MDNSVEKLRDLVAGWIDVFTTQGERAVDLLGLKTGAGTWSPPVDVVESAENVQVFVNLPGVDPHTVEVLLSGNMLNLRGDVPRVHLPAGEKIHRRERFTGTFARSIPLPAPVDPDKVVAEARNGVLTVTLSKEDRVKPRQIPVAVTPGAPTMSEGM
jgi:HSP20 family protein